MKTAILVDGGFFLKRYSNIKGFEKKDPPEIVAKNLVNYCFAHIRRINQYRSRYNLESTELHRIYYYDAKPFDGDSWHPISKKTFNFKKTSAYLFREELFNTLKEQRKIALRLGFLKNSSKTWSIKSKFTKQLINGSLKIEDLKESDLEFNLNQKAVDMKVGIDIATLAYKKQVSQIILIAGDSDFVPASKLARKEGIDFILDPMMNYIDSSLHEHIDGKMTIKNMKKK